MVLAIGGSTIWLKIDEEETRIFGTWGSEADEEPVQVAGLYDELLEIYQ